MRSLTFTMAATLVVLATAFASVVPTSLAQDATVYTVTGRVLSDAGVPLEGVSVSGWTSPPSDGDEKMRPAIAPGNVLTDAEGRYSLQLGAGKGYLNVYYEKWRQSDGREILVEGDMTVDFTLKTPPPKDAIVTGRILDASGNPIEGAEVSLSGGCCYAYATDPVAAEGSGAEGGAGTSSSEPSSIVAPEPWYDDYANVRTGADGVYRFETYAGLRQVSAYAAGYAQSSTQVEARAGMETAADLTLSKVPAKDAVVSGRVVDAKTGLPIEGASVSLRNLEWGRYAWAETDRDGAFRFETIPGWSEISVSVYARYLEPVILEGDAIAKPMPAVPDVQYFAQTRIERIASGANDLELRLDPKPTPTIALVGYVVDPDAKAGVPGATVSFYNQETGDWGQAETDATGSFRILVRAGHYTANAWKTGYLGGSQTFVVTDEATQRVDVLLPKGEPKWAPCYDATDCGIYRGGVAYADAPTAAPSTQPMSPESKGLATDGAGAPSAEAGDDGDSSGSRAAAFSGAGGGLPPYDPDATGVPAASAERGGSQVPGLGLVAGLAAVGIALALLRRRS